MKRFIADCLGNYVFFCPLVIALTPPLRNVDGALAYLLAAIPITLIGARTYTLFLTKVWYPLWSIKF